MYANIIKCMYTWNQTNKIVGSYFDLDMCEATKVFYSAIIEG